MLQKAPMSTIKRKPARVAYYARNVALDLCPPLIFRRRLGKLLHHALSYDREDTSRRVNYYNKLSGPVARPADAVEIQNIPLKKTFYYYDLKEHARYFPGRFRLNYLFGDITRIPGRPSFLKSRPIGSDNMNSIVMKLDKFRHFYLPADKTRFEDKRPIAVWRGGGHNRTRVELVRRYRGHPLCDIGYTDVDRSDSRYGAFLPPVAQMQFRYILSIEGNDVASNLKWIMASNSLCLMPEPIYETWLMEGRLEAGKHYVPLRSDLDDLEDKILHYERHPEEARTIVRNANLYMEQFRDARREQVLSILVMYKYFVATGQLEPDPALAKLLALEA